MKAMRIDFAQAGWRAMLHRVHPGVLVGAAAGVLLCAAAAVLTMQAMQQRAEREERLRLQQQKQAAALRAPARLPETAIPEAQAAAVNAAILQLNLPWRDLQDAVASATPQGIALLALDPEPRKRLLKITAEARSSDEMVAYIEQLKQQEFFVGAALVRHEINEQDPNRPLRFQVEAQWRAQ
jgi:Tfp pilus assembly protein PilN